MSPLDPGPVPRPGGQADRGLPAVLHRGRWPRARPTPSAIRGASPPSSTPRTATTTWWGTTHPLLHPRPAQVPRLHPLPKAPLPTPTIRSPTTSGTSSRSPPKPRTCSPGCSATEAFRPATGTWTDSAPYLPVGQCRRRARLGQGPLHDGPGDRLPRLRRGSGAGRSDPDSHQLDLVEAIDRREFPSWTMKVQVMPDGRGFGLSDEPLRPDQSVAAKGLPPDGRGPAHSQPQPRQLLRGR